MTKNLMSLSRWLLRILTVAAAMPIGMACAQSITISPSTGAKADLGATVQFSAAVTGLSNTKVDWYAGGTLGGTSTVGKISASGLYTAPTTQPSPKTVTIKAVSEAQASVTASVTLTVLGPAPTITSVTPNPLPVGAITVTVNGTGFKTGATVYDTSNGKSTALTTSSVTSTTVTATGTQVSADSATFTARNPGGSASNAVSLPIKTYILTVTNGTGSGKYVPGKVVTITADAPPKGDLFTDWTGATVTNANAASTTIKMPAANTTVTANYAPPTQVPFPVSTHPRIWITSADLTKLRSWAVSTNPVYQKGILPLLATAINHYETQYFPKGVANTNYPDLGDTQGYQGLITEEDGFVLAFNSLIDPSTANRIKYAQYARNLVMYAMDLAAKGVSANAPFRDPAFPIYNRGDAVGHQWSLIVDWIYNATDASNKPILSSSDKATIRKVFMIWANECLNASTTGGDHPEPIGTTNSFSLIGGGKAPYRMASNNYYLGHARNLTMMALAIDPVDDPVLNSAKGPAVLGNTLRSYILDATGAWLYQTYAMMGDPAQVAADYKLPGNGAGFGLASGGLPPEGMLYGESYATLLGQLLALQTSGFNDPNLSGPQIKLIGAPVWDRFVTGFISSLTPTSSIHADESWLGPVYMLAAFGDVLENWVTPDQMQPFAFLSVLEEQLGKTTHLNTDSWFISNVVQGGVIENTSNPWTWGTVQSILYYLVLDPKAASPTDPRPTFPLNWSDPMTGRVLAHSDWTHNSTWFDYRASWESINHQQGDAGEFEFFRNGEWLTKEMSNYDNNLVGFTPYYLNSLCLKNWCPGGTPSLGWDETGIWANGGQWMWAGNAGDPTTISSNGAGYTYATSDLTHLYNRPDPWSTNDNATDVTQATRSALWVNKDYVVVYDRATSIHTGLFKTFNLSLATAPIINGDVATETMGDGQKLFIQTLLPKSPTITARQGANDLNPHSDMDPMFFVLTVQDKTLPADTRFLHVLQGSDPSGKMVDATYVTNATGTAFDGAAFGNTAVFFLTYSNSKVATTTFSVPSSVHMFVVAGLAANSSFKVTTQPGTNTTTVTLTPGTTGSVSDSAGLLKVSI